MSEKVVSRTKTVLKILGFLLTGLAVWAIINEYKIITDAFDKITGRGFALWIWGFWVSLVGGHFVPHYALKLYRARLYDKKKPPPAELPSWMIGLTEGFVFTLLIGIVGFETAVAAAMAGYISIKVATGWASRPDDKAPDNENFTHWKARVYSSLLGNLLSMSFAVLGGSICHLAISSNVPVLPVLLK